MDKIKTIRYMGNKITLLDFIIPKIIDNTKPGDVILDMMSGTSSIGYALKQRNKIYSNDVQYYSFVISKALLMNYLPLKSEFIKKLIIQKFEENLNKKKFNYFEQKYSDTYFSKKQCIEIDSLRYAIDTIEEPFRDYLLTLLMASMTKVQSSPGHFAQYMPKNNKRIKPLRKLSVFENFLDKADDFNNFVISKFDNKIFNVDYRELFNKNLVNDVACFYLDSPYTSDHYSRFYHVLETVCLYDNPILQHKGLYRQDRFKSTFGYKKKAYIEFDFIMKKVSELKKVLIISYSSRGIVELDELLELARKHFNKVELFEEKYNHSRQGSGKISVVEYLIVLK